MSEAWVLCEGFYDRDFWAGWLLRLGCIDPGEQLGGPRRRVLDPWSKLVTSGHFAFHSKSAKFVRVVPCNGKSNILRYADDRLKRRVIEKLHCLVVNVDSDAEASESAARDMPTVRAVENLLTRHGRYEKEQQGDFRLEDGTLVAAPVCWSAGDPAVPGIPTKQTLERLVCAAILAVYPDRGPAVQNWLDSRPAAPLAGPKEHAWSYMAGWYAEFGSDSFFREIWRDEGVATQLESRLKACGAWRIGEYWLNSSAPPTPATAGWLRSRRSGEPSRVTRSGEVNSSNSSAESQPCSSDELLQRLRGVALGPLEMLGQVLGLVVAEPLDQRGQRGRAVVDVQQALLAIGHDAGDTMPGEDVAGVGQQVEHRQNTVGHQRQELAQLQIARGGRLHDHQIVAHHGHRHLGDGLGDHRVHLAGHDRRAGLAGRQPDLAQPGVRAGREQAEIVGALQQVAGQGGGCR